MPFGGLLTVGILGVVGGIASAGIGANAAGNAASTQANAANYAASLQHQDAQAALQFQQQVYNTGQQNLQPWLRSGTSALYSLDNLLGISPGSPQSAAGSPVFGGPAGAPGGSPIQRGPINGGPVGGGPRRPISQLVQAGTFTDGPGSNLRYANENGVPTIANRTVPASAVFGGPAGARPPNSDFGSLMKPFSEQFQAPTDVTEQNDPGYKFRLSQGLDALQNSAAARGNLLSGNTAKAINDYAQNSASSEYGNVYNRSLGEYQQRFNQFQIGQNNQFNRLADVAGIGQTAAQQLNSAGQGAAGNVSNILLTSGQQIGNNINNAGAARASGYINGANAINGGIGSITSQLGQLYSLQQLLSNRNPYGAPGSGPVNSDNGFPPFINP